MLNIIGIICIILCGAMLITNCIVIYKLLTTNRVETVLLCTDVYMHYLNGDGNISIANVLDVCAINNVDFTVCEAISMALAYTSPVDYDNRGEEEESYLS